MSKNSKAQAPLLELEIPGLPPTTNQIYRTGSGRSFRYKTKETRDWETRVTCLMRAAKTQATNTKHVALHVTFTTPGKRRWDLDNRLKVLQDCLQKSGVIKDDSQIWELHIKREQGSETTTTIFLERVYK